MFASFITGDREVENIRDNNDNKKARKRRKQTHVRDRPTRFVRMNNSNFFFVVYIRHKLYDRTMVRRCRRWNTSVQLTCFVQYRCLPFVSETNEKKKKSLFCQNTSFVPIKNVSSDRIITCTLLWNSCKTVKKKKAIIYNRFMYVEIMKKPIYKYSSGRS